MDCSLIAANHEEAEQLERAIVKDFRNDLKGHKERLQQSHRVRIMQEIMQERAKKLVCYAKFMHMCSMQESEHYMQPEFE